MSLSDLDRLLSTPVTERVRRPRKSRVRSQTKMTEIESATDRVQKWRLSSTPVSVAVWVQRTRCISCNHTDEATISPILVGFRDRLGRTHYQSTHIVPPGLPASIHYSDSRVEACHRCITACCRPAAPGYQFQINFSRRAPCKALVPIHATGQALMWVFWALQGAATTLGDTA